MGTPWDRGGEAGSSSPGKKERHRVSSEAGVTGLGRQGNTLGRGPKAHVCCRKTAEPRQRGSFQSKPGLSGLQLRVPVGETDLSLKLTAVTVRPGPTWLQEGLTDQMQGQALCSLGKNMANKAQPVFAELMKTDIF